MCPADSGQTLTFADRLFSRRPQILKPLPVLFFKQTWTYVFWDLQSHSSKAICFLYPPSDSPSYSWTPLFHLLRSSEQPPPSLKARAIVVQPTTVISVQSTSDLMFSGSRFLLPPFSQFRSSSAFTNHHHTTFDVTTPPPATHLIPSSKVAGEEGGSRQSKMLKE
ncbi:hypothetical protein LXL04_005960 [Taraxacum kok-saghyz]